MEPVAAGDEIALQHPLGSVAIAVANRRPFAGRVDDAHGGGVKARRVADTHVLGDEVFDHLVLAVDHDALAGQVGEVEVMTAPGEAQIDAVVDEPFASHARTDAQRVEQIDRAVLEHAGADALLAVLAAARLENDRRDPGPAQQQRQDQTGRTGADDPDLRALDGVWQTLAGFAVLACVSRPPGARRRASRDVFDLSRREAGRRGDRSAIVAAWHVRSWSPSAVTPVPGKRRSARDCARSSATSAARRCASTGTSASTVRSATRSASPRSIRARTTLRRWMEDLTRLAHGSTITKPVYNHQLGAISALESVEPREIVLVQGLFPLYTSVLRALFDVSVWLEPDPELKLAWTIRRDVAERGYREEQVRAELQRRRHDYETFIAPQATHADIRVSFGRTGVTFHKSARLVPLDYREFSSESTRIRMIDDHAGRYPRSIIEVDANISAPAARSISDAILRGIGARNAPSRPERLGTHADDGGPAVSWPLAITQLLIARRIALVADQLSGAIAV